jgi:hypothetical protein
MTTRTVGPFTWVQERLPNRSSLDKEEVWTLQRPEGMTHFVLKNYGGTPGPGFAGWKLVSGGPFDSAGAYDSFESAAQGVVPYLIQHYREQAAELRATAERMLAQVTGFERTLGRPKCDGCHQEIDPDCCCCGAPINGYHDNHSPVPMGCQCFRDKGEEA